MMIFCSYTQRSFDQKVSNDLIKVFLPHPSKAIPLRFRGFFGFNEELFSSGNKQKDKISNTRGRNRRPEINS